MPLLIDDMTIERVSIVDDNDEARTGWGYSIEDIDLTPIPELGPLNDLGEFVKEVSNHADAMFCDYRLTISNYASFDGHQIVAECYKNNFPAILCTNFKKADLDLIRPYRRYIPVLFSNDDVEDPDVILRGFELCIEEFKSKFRPNRKPWRSLIRVEEVEIEGAPGYFYVVLPGWNPNERIRMLLDGLPDSIRALIEPGKRLHAQVNVGAENQDDLYFDTWEID